MFKEEIIRIMQIPSENKDRNISQLMRPELLCIISLYCCHRLLTGLLTPDHHTLASSQSDVFKMKIKMCHPFSNPKMAFHHICLQSFIRSALNLFDLISQYFLYQLPILYSYLHKLHLCSLIPFSSSRVLLSAIFFAQNILILILEVSVETAPS